LIYAKIIRSFLRLDSGSKIRWLESWMKIDSVLVGSCNIAGSILHNSLRPSSPLTSLPPHGASNAISSALRLSSAAAGDEVCQQSPSRAPVSCCDEAARDWSAHSTLRLWTASTSNQGGSVGIKRSDHSSEAMPR
jgi:hypothetical protein